MIDLYRSTLFISSKHNSHVLQARRELFGFGVSAYGFGISINLYNDLLVNEFPF